MKAINNIKYESQRDSRWSNIKMGLSQTTLGRAGCTSTCVSMITDFFGCKKTPKEIAENPKNYFKESADFNWSTMDFPTFSFRWRHGSYFQEIPIDMDMIKAYLAHGDNSENDNNRAVLLEVANHSHWVVGLWVTYDGDILAIDPWTGRTCEVLKEYGNITGAAFFIRGKVTSRLEPKAPNYD